MLPTSSRSMESWASPPMRPPWAPRSPRPPAPSTSRCSSSFSVRRCPALTPRRPSWPAGTCSTPPPPARWASTLSRTSPGPLDFQMLLQLFGEKMSGTDPEETIMAGWHLFDPTASGEMGVDAVKNLLCSRGVKADRLTEAEVAQMFDQVKPAGGKFNYGKFTRIMKRGSDE